MTLQLQIVLSCACVCVCIWWHFGPSPIWTTQTDRQPVEIWSDLLQPLSVSFYLFKRCQDNSIINFRKWPASLWAWLLDRFISKSVGRSVGRSVSQHRKRRQRQRHDNASSSRFWHFGASAPKLTYSRFRTEELVPLLGGCFQLLSNNRGFIKITAGKEQHDLKYVHGRTERKRPTVRDNRVAVFFAIFSGSKTRLLHTQHDYFSPSNDTALLLLLCIW